MGRNHPTDREESRNGWGSQCLHVPNHGCPVEHSKWCIRFCSVLDKNVYERTAYCIVHSSNWSMKNAASIEFA